MASEPAPRQDELDREWLAGMIAAFLSGARGVGVLHMKPWPEVAERLVAWLDERGLLADPAQTTELEQAKRAYETAANEINKYAAQLTRKCHTIRDLTDENRRLAAERDERQARIDRAKAVLQVEGDDLTDWHAGYRAACERGLAALAGDQPTTEATDA